MQHCPYPLDVAWERFYTGKTQKHRALAHFRNTPVATDVAAWFHHYNACPTIEAGIKETKQVFRLRRQSPEGAFRACHLWRQGAIITIFAANFIRWATVWIEQHALPGENALPLAKLGLKKQVQVAAHTSATVIQNSGGMLLKFSHTSAFASAKQVFLANLFFAVFHVPLTRVGLDCTPCSDFWNPIGTWAEHDE